MPLSELSAFPTEFIRPLPHFNSDGVLDRGDYAPTRAEFEERFVETGDHRRRRFLYEGWNRYREALLKAGISRSAWQLMDGSFTTAKTSPDDIDIAVEVPIVSIMEKESHPARELFDSPAILLRYKCHAFAIYSLPIVDPNYGQTTGTALKFWTNCFSNTRERMSKGRVWVRIGGLK